MIGSGKTVSSSDSLNADNAYYFQCEGRSFYSSIQFHNLEIPYLSLCTSNLGLRRLSWPSEC